MKRRDPTLLGCLPGGYPCEHFITDPFVDHLNNQLGSKFSRILCPDKIDSTKPAPDALYEEPMSEKRLAVEHKALVWPPHFAKGHRNDHYLMEAVSSGIGQEMGKGSLCLELPYLLMISKEEITELADEIVQSALRYKRQLLLGTHQFTSPWRGRKWVIRPAESWELEQQVDGIVFQWNSFDQQSRAHQQESFSRCIERLLSNAAGKFDGYATQRIVLLELVGDSFMTHKAGELFNRLAPPSGQIDQVWTALYEYGDGEIDEIEGFWVYELEWPRQQQVPE